MDFLDPMGLVISCGRLKLAIFDVSYVINASVVSNENSQIQNGGHYNDSTMFCLGQKIHISARVAVH